MKWKDRDLPLVQHMAQLVAADPTTVATYPVPNASEADRFVRMHQHLKRVMAEQSLFELEPNHPLYGWGLLAYQHAYIGEDPENPEQALFVITQTEKLQPTLMMELIHIAATKSSKVFSPDEALGSSIRTYIDAARQGKRVLYPIVAEEVAKLIVKDVPGGTSVSYQKAYQHTQRSKIILIKKPPPEH